MTELAPEHIEQALAELERIVTTLAQLSAWCDGPGPARERASIAMEDAAQAVMAAGWLLERTDPEPPSRARVAQLVHRRVSP